MYIYIYIYVCLMSSNSKYINKDTYHNISNPMFIKGVTCTYTFLYFLVLYIYMYLYHVS